MDVWQGSDCGNSRRLHYFNQRRGVVFPLPWLWHRRDGLWAVSKDRASLWYFVAERGEWVLIYRLPVDQCQVHLT